MLWLALVASVGALHPLFQGWGWWFASSLVAALVLAASAAVRAARWPAVVAWLGGVVVAALASTIVVSGGTAVLGIVPTAATLERVRLLSEQARDSIVGDQAPIPVDQAMLAVIVVSVAAAALLVDLVARVARVPAATGVVFVIILVVPSFIPDIDPAWFGVILTVVAYVGVLVASTGRRPSRSALVSGVSAVVVAGVVTSLLPVSLSSPITGAGSGTGISTGVNPAIDLGKNLRRGSPIEVLTYKTSSSTGEYLKLVDLVDFSGTTWSPASVKLDPAADVSSLPAAPGIAASTRRDRVTTNVAVNLLRSPYLPLPVPAAKITGIDDKWKYVDAAGVTVRSTSEGSQGLRYKVTSRPVDPTESQIVDSIGSPSADMGAYLDVKGVPASIRSLAKKVTSGSPNPFDAAVDLQDYFRNGSFTYSEDTPVREGYDGTGLDMVKTFLKTKSGYCVHFASAMAVMARTLDIPSRIAVGFLPGTQADAGVGSDWQVTSNDLHTWPELYFQGLGWVPFEPTVGQGTTAAYLQPTGTEATAAPTASPSASDSPATTTQPTDEATTSATATDGSTSSTAAGTTSTAATNTTGLAAGGIVVLVVLLLLPWWLRLARRRRRLSQSPPNAASAAWREVVETARDLGVGVDPAATPQVAATRLSEVLARSPARVELARLLAAVESERFGGLPADRGIAESARVVVSGLQSSVSVQRRLLALFAPRTLFVEAPRQRPA